MKFGKEFRSQMVPEWHEAYLDYRLLKTSLEQIKNSKQNTHQQSKNLKRNNTLYRTFSGLTYHAKSSQNAAADIENQVILVNNVKKDGFERFETTFLNGGDEGGEYELAFFKRLDAEFNKVLEFYKSKVGEVMEEAGVLNKQMDALIAFRFKVEHPKGWVNRVEETVQMASDVANSTKELSANAPFEARSSSRRVSMDVIDEESSRTMRRLEESNDEDNEESKTFDESVGIREMEQVNIQIQEVEQDGSIRRVPLEVLNQVKFNNDLGTPRATIKGFLNLPNQTDLKFSKDNLIKAEAQLKKAFVVFYHKLTLLKNYCFLNTLAVSKIMKKYDKIASRSALRPYMNMVDTSYLGSSDEVSRLMERVEVSFVNHFSNSNRSKGMKILRPTVKRERHRTSFATGFLVGCLFALILALIKIIRAHSIIDREGRDVYMVTSLPVYRLFGFVVLHMLMYAANIYFWRRYRVNYSFIFGFKQGTELGYREVLLVSFSVGVLALASVLANLDIEMDPVMNDYQGVTELIPLGLVMLVVAVMVCPLNIIYRSSRFFLLTSLLHCVLAPLYKVTLPDFMLADQLTSQVQAIRSLQFYVCYYGWGYYKVRENNCRNSQVFNTFSFIVVVIPFWWRLLQCLRRMREERDIMQGYNGVKYFMTIVAVCARTAYTHDRGDAWKYSALVISIIATIISTYWDIVMDWGLLQPKAKNRWLRDKLLVPYKSVYFVAIVLNVLLRLAWMQTVMNITIFSLHRQIMITLVASLEIIRRGIWNFFRLENEHLNNVGKFRAFKSVPLPFNYDDEDKDD